MQEPFDSFDGEDSQLLVLLLSLLWTFLLTHCCGCSFCFCFRLLLAFPEYVRIKREGQAIDTALDFLKKECKIDVDELLREIRWELWALPWFAFEGMPLPKCGISWCLGGHTTMNGWHRLQIALDAIFADGASTVAAFCVAFGWGDPIGLTERYVSVCRDDEALAEEACGKKVLHELKEDVIICPAASHESKEVENVKGSMTAMLDIAPNKKRSSDSLARNFVGHCTPSPLVKKRRMD